MARTAPRGEHLSLKDKLVRLADRMKDPEWRRYGFTLASGKVLGLALVFGMKSKVNDPATYLDYCDAIHRRLNDEKNLIRWQAELGKQKISDVRKMEFCLYAYGKSGSLT